MGLRENLSKSVKKGGLSNSELHHPSRAYERHFEGYVETAEDVPGQKRARSVRTYVDTIWVREATERKTLMLRILFVILFLLSLVLFLYASVQDIPANRVWFVTAPQALSLFSLGWTALTLARYCLLPQEMTVRQHRLGVTHFHRANALAWIFLFVLAGTYILFALLYPAQRSTALPGALLCLLAGAAQLVVFWTEHTVSYVDRDNPMASEY